MSYCIPLLFVATASAMSTLAPSASAMSTLAPYLKRLEALEPVVRSLCDEPRRLERLAQEYDGGLLFGVKDNMACDGLPPATCGAQLPASAHAINAGPEAAVVRKLRAIGTILGKTSLAEFAALAPPPTTNPRDAARTPGGSSSGSAAAVAAGFCDAALGTQTIGSIGRPAAFCGVVGFAPSRGRVDASGVDAYSSSIDVVGCLAKDAATAARVGAAIVDGWDDRASAPSTLVVPDGAYMESFSPTAKRLFEASLAALEGCPGVSVVRQSGVLDDIAAVTNMHRELINSELAAAHAERFAEHESLYSPETRKLILAHQTPASEAARRSPLETRAALHAVLGGRVFVTPGAASGVAPRGHATTGDPAAQLPWSHAGLPSLTLPAGLHDGMPHAIQLVAAHGRDEGLLDLGAVLEHRFPPLEPA